MTGEGREEKAGEGREEGGGEGRGGRRMDGRGGLSGNVAEEAFCLKSAPVSLRGQEVTMSQGKKRSRNVLLAKAF